MSPYLKNLCKIEFVVTYACTGRCKHCSEGGVERRDERIDARVASRLVRRVAEKYDIKTVMTFGGEPLLYTDAVYSIISAAKDAGVPHRQLITNGYFTRDEGKIAETTERLALCGVNDLLLSVDAFHQETIPLSVVRRFAKAASARGIPVRLQPAWLKGAEHSNPYNDKTKEILASLSDLRLPLGRGNVIFPEGNALKFLGKYFEGERPENPYTQDPCQVKCLSFDPDGAVLDGNFYERDVMEILKNYAPSAKE